MRLYEMRSAKADLITANTLVNVLFNVIALDVSHDWTTFGSMRRQCMSTKRFLETHWQLQVQDFRDRSEPTESDHLQVDLARLLWGAKVATLAATVVTSPPRALGQLLRAWAHPRMPAADHSLLPWPTMATHAPFCLLRMRTVEGQAARRHTCTITNHFPGSARQHRQHSPLAVIVPDPTRS